MPMVMKEAIFVTLLVLVDVHGSEGLSRGSFPKGFVFGTASASYQVCCLGGRSVGPAAATIVIGSSLLLFGLVKRQGAGVGICIKPQGEVEEKDEDEEFNMVLSMNHLDTMCKQYDKLVNFLSVPEQHAHVEWIQVDGKYVEKIHPFPNEPNSYRLHSSIYTALNACSLDSICVMHLPTSDSD